MPESAPPPPALAGLTPDAVAAALAAQAHSPVERWDPPFCGHSNMRISADGRWFHEGTPVARPAMVRLFGRVLRREADGRYVLVTPAEKLEIDVEVAPFHAVEVASEGAARGRTLTFRMAAGELARCDSDHPLSVLGTAEAPAPRLLIRPGIEATLARSVWYELVEWALADGEDPPAIWSAGARFALEPAA